VPGAALKAMSMSVLGRRARGRRPGCTGLASEALAALRTMKLAFKGSPASRFV
jgi:hypothetical protein